MNKKFSSDAGVEFPSCKGTWVESRFIWIEFLTTYLPDFPYGKKAHSKYIPIKWTPLKSQSGIDELLFIPYLCPLAINQHPTLLKLWSHVPILQDVEDSGQIPVFSRGDAFRASGGPALSVAARGLALARGTWSANDPGRSSEGISIFLTGKQFPIDHSVFEEASFLTQSHTNFTC